MSPIYLARYAGKPGYATMLDGRITFMDTFGTVILITLENLEALQPDKRTRVIDEDTRLMLHTQMRGNHAHLAVRME